MINCTKLNYIVQTNPQLNSNPSIVVPLVQQSNTIKQLKSNFLVNLVTPKLIEPIKLIQLSLGQIKKNKQI